jgi:hypothetical protein
MKTWSWISMALLSGVLGCSSGGGGGFSGDGTGDTSSSSGGGSSGGGSSGGGSSGASSSGASSGGSTSGGVYDGGINLLEDAAVHSLYDSSLPDGSTDQPITLVLDKFTVAPNAEVYKCQNFGNPFGHAVDIIKMDGAMDQGSHHFFLFNMAPETGRTAPGPIQDCPGNGIEFHPFPYLSQQQGHYIVTYPQADMGYPLLANNGLTINVHYLNTGTTPITPTVTMTIYPAKAGVVKTHVGSIFLNNTFFTVPNGTVNQWFSKTYTPFPAGHKAETIFTNWSHMHQWATDFQAITPPGGQVFYDETIWAEPPLITAAPAGVTPAPPHTSAMLPFQLQGGQQIQWQCKYTNTTGRDLSFGDSARDNVMCIYIGQYYPADDTTAPGYPDIISVLN